MTSLHRAFVFVCFVASCGGGGGGNDAGGPLTAQAPYLSSVSGSVRNVVVTANAAATQINEPASCTLEADLFDAPVAQSLTPMATSGECVLYGGSTSLDLSGEQWVCAGAVIASYGSQSTALTLCPMPGANVTPTTSIDCTGLDPGATVMISSGDEVPNDAVTDLSGMVTLPAAIAFQAPSTFAITDWPTTGDLAVQWSSANATAALVTLAPRNASGPAPFVVCRPSVNGTVTIASDLLFQGNLRASDAMLRVHSYRDATTTAEMGHTYHLFAGVEAAMVLQAH